MLFEETIFGPIRSRRLGTSLGVNLLPVKKKYCNYNCVYCECGWNEDTASLQTTLADRDTIRKALEKKLEDLQAKGIILDSITFAGNGEPTIHPDFAKIVTDVVELRNRFYPNAKTTVLTNATKLSDKNIFEALQKIDNPVLKLDSGTKEMHTLINQGNKQASDFEELVGNLIRFGSKGIIQTLLFRGISKGNRIDNTEEKEFATYVSLLKRISPRYVMLYGLDRVAPEKDLEKLSHNELEFYAEKIRKEGIEVKVYS